ncbi:hypothetical protein ACFVHW_11420 [Streptomyces sp. NPDC127110]|uniref:hypothetical protein n=1 Tax=Streptomyces sp. NPDC127110 TaxID=3345362 RepID=UPI00364254E1
MGVIAVYLLAGLLGVSALAVGVDQLGPGGFRFGWLYAGLGLVAAGLAVVFPGVVVEGISALA